jgi:hypothetical protein
MEYERYIVSARNLKLQIGRGFGIGSEFFHHDGRMVVTTLGRPYTNGGTILQGFAATQEDAAYCSPKADE